MSIPTPDGQHDLVVRKLEIERAKIFIEFAKFGFRGTLAGGIGGMFLLLGLAILQATTNFALETWGYVGIAVVILVAVTAYGYFSLWSLPTIAAKYREVEIALSKPS